MEFTIRYSLDTLPFKPRGRVVALGLFDGVHKGHLAIIRDAVRKAAAEGLTSCVQTFINIPKSDGGELTTPEERLAILSGLGVDELLVLDYNEVCGMAPGDFVADCLLVRMGAAAVVVGDDYRFGCGASGDVGLLKSLCTPLAIDVNVHDALVTDGRKISSTWLRELLTSGHPDMYAALCSGRYFSYTGKVVTGKQMGHLMGFPTANLDIPGSKIVIRRGVYASRVTLGKRILYGVTNVGLRPTLEDTTRDVCETFIFDFDEDIYGAVITVEPVAFVRAETRFDSREALMAQVEADKVRAKEIIGEVFGE